MTRRERLRAREGDEFMRRWHALWDAAEDHYFRDVRPAHTFDFVLTVEQGARLSVTRSIMRRGVSSVTKL